MSDNPEKTSAKKKYYDKNLMLKPDCANLFTQLKKEFIRRKKEELKKEGMGGNYNITDTEFARKVFHTIQNAQLMENMINENQSFSDVGNINIDKLVDNINEKIVGKFKKSFGDDSTSGKNFLELVKVVAGLTQKTLVIEKMLRELSSQISDISTSLNDLLSRVNY